MLRGGVRGFLRILTLVNPPRVTKPIFLAAVSHELPYSACAGAGKRQRLESTFRLRQIDQVLGQALFLQHAGNHLAITPRPAQPGFHDGASARRLEKIEERKHLVVYRKRQVVRDAFGGLLGPLLQPRINRKSHLRHFINGRGNSGSFAEAVSRAEGLQLVGIHGVHHAVEQLAQLGVAVGIVAALQHPVDGVVKILACGFQMTGLEILLAGGELFLDLLDQVVLARRNWW